MAGSLLLSLSLTAPGWAQSITTIPDGTGTIITIDGNTYHIQGGTQAGANLFHSFQDFGLSSGEIANFLSNPSVSNIFGRVTGGNASIIDGLIQANPNLYLMNPAGMVFGANASLNVGGDFFATTSDRIGFTDGEFNATGFNDYTTLVGTPNQFAFLSEQPGAIVNFGELTTTGDLTLLGGTVVNQGEIVATGKVAIAAIPGTRLVRLSEPGMLLSLDILPPEATATIRPLDLPELLTGSGRGNPPVVAPNPTRLSTGALPLQNFYNRSAGILPATRSIINGDLVINGEVTGSQIDLYAAGQVTPTDAGLIQGDTRVIRFSDTGENPDQAVFIDARADHPENLLYGAAAGTVSQIVESDENGIAVISEQLAEISESVGELESVAIVAEGNEGSFWLGNQWIRSDNIGDYATQLQSWRSALTESADLLLYSCFTALGATGEALVTSLANLTGADVAASLNATGSANYGGDWQLEHQTGAIEAENPFTSATLDTWDGKLATLFVTDFSDGGGANTLRSLINSAAAGDTILFTSAATVTLGGAQINWTTNNLTLDGNGGTVSGGSSSRVFNITANNATVQDLTIRDGVVSGDGAAINRNANGTLTLNNVTITDNSASGRGGGIRNANGTVALINSTISSNTAGVGGAGIFNNPGTLTLTNSSVVGNAANRIGGGIWNGGTLSLTNSTVSGNTSNTREGGGIFSNTGTVTLNSSTVSSNSSQNRGGGISIVNGATLTLVNSTVSGNTTNANGGGISSTNGDVTLTNSTIAFNTSNAYGGGFYTQNTVTSAIANTIIANNTAAGFGNDIRADLSSSTVQNSLIPDTAGISGLTLTNGVNGNIIGQDPLLGPLQNNGGSTATHALLTGSPAINGGNNTLVSVTLDQAGNLRISDGTVDIGAYEVQTETVTTVTPPTCDLDCTPVPPTSPPEPELTGDGESLLDAGAEEAEANITNDYADLGGDEAIAPVSLSESQNILQRLTAQTGEEPALIYFNFVPTVVAQGEPETLVASTELRDLGRDRGSDWVSQNFTGQNSQADHLQLSLVTAYGDPIVVRLPRITRRLVNQQLRAFRRGLVQPQGQRYLRPAQRLHDWLIAPLEPHLQHLGIDNLSIIAAQGLRSLPMAALHDGENFLIEQYSVGLIPSLSLIDWRYQPLHKAPVLAMGASQFVNQVSLPAVPAELALITEARSGVQYLNDQFTYANLQAQSQGRQFKILHLATHATFNPRAPQAAYVQLWGEETLQLNNLRDLKLYEDPAVELLVLSACQTAIGNPEAELGFAGAALQAGVKSVLASLWMVSDWGTVVLMDEFYRQLADPAVATKAEALRRAQLTLLQGNASLLNQPAADLAALTGLSGNRTPDLTHPFYWSAFTLVGSPW
ncbi:MAG: CHAT domain-containing protein [Spirulinaceae cyanobacterium]